MFDEHILPDSPRGGNRMFREALAPAGTYAPSFKIPLLIYLALGALCTAAWCSGSGSVPSETAEPTYGAQSYGCVFIKALQSKVFSEILLICVNFLVTAHGFTNARAGKMLLRVIGHKKYYGRSQYLLYEVYVSLVYPNRVLSYHEFTATSIPKKTFLLHLDKKITPEPFHS